MSTPPSKSRPLNVPASRARRLTGLGGMASTIAGRMAATGLRQLASGQRPAARDLLLTPQNAQRIADELARMRGAAMKVGQLISMDSGEMLPPELAQIMARLRADADHMPPRQLKQVLSAEWGEGWLARFKMFNVRPIAAASIGQVHRAHTKDGRDLAIKVQYPGVARSIDSDIQNVGALLKLSGLLPKGIEIGPLLEDAKTQLREEADYLREAAELRRFRGFLDKDRRFVLPEAHADLSTPRILAMTFVEGGPIEDATHATQEVRDTVASHLLELIFREIFEFRWIQSDPNFANYRYKPDTGQIVLLDFGAARPVPTDLVEAYRALFTAALAGEDLAPAALSLGLYGPKTQPKHQRMVLDMLDLVFGPLTSGAPFDFGDPAMMQQITAAGQAMAEERDFVHIPPTETLFVQRKFAGLFLLCTRLRARVDLVGILAPYLKRA